MKPDDSITRFARALGTLLLVTLATLTCARRAEAQSCPLENECTFEKPNVLIVMDYSSSMVQQAFGSTTRWQAQLNAVRSLLQNKGFTDDMHIAFTRFGHDPATSAGTTLPGDTSSPRITDGFAIDVPFDDASANYLDCNSGAIEQAIDRLPPPPNGPNYVGTWTKGALDSALAMIARTRKNHPADTNRAYEVVLMTDGDWNCRDSFTQANCDGGPGEPNENPVPSAATLLSNNVRVHVLAFGDATTAPDLDAVAKSGGTDAAIDASSPLELVDALEKIVQKVRDAVIVPECIGGLPRVMLIIDASSSMMVGSAPGESNWDKARFAVAGNPDARNPGEPGYVQPIFDRTVQVGRTTVTIEDVVHIGMMAFNNPDVQKLMLQYAPCARDNLEWAMDPYTSCAPPGCTDPYRDPDTNLTWTFRDSDSDRNPPFVQDTRSFMPNCNPNGPARCMGAVFNTYTGEGVSFARVNQARYTANSGSFNLDPDTPFVNILITDGKTSPDSADPVPVLTDMLTNGVATYVIGFGAPADLDLAALDTYAKAGGTGTATTVDPNQGGSASALADRIAGIIGGLHIDPCCQLNDCRKTPEPPLPFCGNGTLDKGEACDVGPKNGAKGGVCSASCAAKTFCGDGKVTGAEECDDANTNDKDGCFANCTTTGTVTGAGGFANGGGSGSGASGAGALSGAGGSGNGAGASGNGTGASGNGAGASGNGTGASGNGGSFRQRQERSLGKGKRRAVRCSTEASRAVRMEAATARGAARTPGTARAAPAG